MIEALRIRFPGFDAAAEAAVAAPRALRAHAVVMAALFVGALVAGYMLLPGINERIAALEQDGQNREALALLEQRFNRGDRSQRTLYQLQRLYEHFGDLAKARQKLEMIAELRPKDPAVLGQLVRFYRQTQNEEGYRTALARQVATRATEPACKDLIGYYRGTGDFASEQSAIEFCRQRNYRRTDDLVRLAYLIAADGRIADASALLRSVDDRRRLRSDRDRRLFFAALIEGGQSVEAQQRALRWLKGSKDQLFALELIDGLVEDKRHDLALDLAREVGAPGDAVSLTVAELLLDRSQDQAARSYLRGWYDKATFTDVDLTHRFVGAALDADDPDLAFIGAEKFGLQRLGQPELVQLAEALSAISRREQFQRVLQAIDTQTLRDNPLLAAAIAVDQGATEPARQLLARVQTDNLAEWRLALWARLMETTGRRPPTARGPTARPPTLERPLAAGTKAGNRVKELRDKRAQRRQRARQPVSPQPAPAAQPKSGGAVVSPAPPPPPSAAPGGG